MGMASDPSRGMAPLGFTPDPRNPLVTSAQPPGCLTGL